jgi:hypothetical protein
VTRNLQSRPSPFIWEDPDLSGYVPAPPPSSGASFSQDDGVIFTQDDGTEFTQG